MNPTLEKDLTELGELLERAVKEGVSYLEDVDQVPTSLKNVDIPQRNLNFSASGSSDVLAEFIKRYKSILVASTGPRFWGFVTGGSTPAALMGDILASIYDQNTQAMKGNGDLSAIIEQETIQWLLELLELPKEFNGGFVTGATMSNYTSLAVGRQWVGKEMGVDVAKEGLSKLSGIPVLSATPHSSAIKCLSMLGIGSKNVAQIKTVEGERETMNIPDLENEIKKLKGAPFMLITSGGTVNSGDFDNFSAISRLKSEYRFWWHIDAAFGAFANCSPEHKHLLKDWGYADSITVDCHKWLNVPYESAVFFIRTEHKRLQIETFQNSNAPYLGSEEKFNYMNLLPENSRRLKALAVWFSLAAYGRDGIRSIIENSIERARQFADLIQDHEQLELLAPVHLNIVAFTLLHGDEQKIDEFLNQVNQRGRVFMTPTSFKGRRGIRAAFVNWRTRANDVEIAIKEIDDVLSAM